MTKIYIAEMELSLYLSLIRAIVRVAVCKAVELECEGELAEGFEIRPALIRCARLRREQQKSRLPRLLAFPIAHTAMLHPKGGPLPKPKKGQEQSRLIQIRFILVWLMGLTFLSAMAILLAVWFVPTTVLRLAARIKRINVSEQKPIKFGSVLLSAIWLMMVVWLWKVSAVKYVWSVYEVTETLLGAGELPIPPQIWRAFLLILVMVETLTLMLIAGLFGRLKGLPISCAVVQGVRFWTTPMVAIVSLLYAVILIVRRVGFPSPLTADEPLRQKKTALLPKRVSCTEVHETCSGECPLLHCWQGRWWD